MNKNNLAPSSHAEDDLFNQLEQDASFTSAYAEFNDAAGKMEEVSQLGAETITSPETTVAHASQRIEAVFANQSEETAPAATTPEQSYDNKYARRLNSLATRLEDGESVADIAKSALKRTALGAFRAMGGDALSLAVSNSITTHQAKRAAKAERQSAIARAEAEAEARRQESQRVLEQTRDRDQAHADSVYDEAHAMNKSFDQSIADAAYDTADAYNKRFDAEADAYTINDRFDLETEAYEMNEAFDVIATAKRDAERKARAKRVAKERRRQDKAAKRAARKELRAERSQERRENSKVRKATRAVIAYSKGVHAAGMESVRTAQAAHEATAAARDASGEQPASTETTTREQFFADNAE